MERERQKTERWISQSTASSVKQSTAVLVVVPSNNAFYLKSVWPLLRKIKMCIFPAILPTPPFERFPKYLKIAKTFREVIYRFEFFSPNFETFPEMLPLHVKVNKTTINHNTPLLLLYKMEAPNKFTSSSHVKETVVEQLPENFCKFESIFRHFQKNIHLHISRFPISEKMNFEEMKAFFFSNTLSSSNFLIFPAKKIFWFLAKKSYISGAKDAFMI